MCSGAEKKEGTQKHSLASAKKPAADNGKRRIIDKYQDIQFELQA